MDAGHWIGIVSAVALILGPLLAVWTQRIGERRQDSKQRKLTLFKELMATRAPSARVNPRHVDALNAVEVEFSSHTRSDKKVLETWTRYVDHLNELTVDSQNKAAVWRWQEETDELFAELLYEMSNALGFTFDKESLKKSLSGRVTFDVFS